jgi:hypothetical protein
MLIKSYICNSFNFIKIKLKKKYNHLSFKFINKILWINKLNLIILYLENQCQMLNQQQGLWTSVQESKRTSHLCGKLLNTNIKKWINKQQFYYKNNINIMKNNNIKIKWLLFMDKYKEYLLNNKELWNYNLEKVKLFIDENKCKPSLISKDREWIIKQQIYYKNNINIMKNNNIKIKWEYFLNEYKEYFLSFN